ncbi:MAG: glutamate 5-kinase [Gammaproteobacteria bacterium]|nr:glutamate 5-kinase [Gammaproteobacteria bacterium]NNF62410.1 glutamate 5-kinase [Gammaproteobacteria bacterium]NNM21205.1 glutamate 5-kinase [Gammaproteobacteria bacterium]
MQKTQDDLPQLTDANRVVIKVGSSLLVDFDSGALNRAWLRSLAGEIARMVGRGQQIVVVSSGAIALGRKYLGFGKEQNKLNQQQAAAASGQILLAHAYQELLGLHDIKAAQLLLTLGDTENRRRYLNARSTLETLLAGSVVPIINENDTVATEEIRYGDNDRLAARVAAMCSADCLVLLSDVDGLYESDPSVDENAKLIPVVHEISADIEARAGTSRTEYGSGGMITKLAAAKICMPAGCATVIANGHRSKPLSAVENDSACTWFIPATTPSIARKRWIAGVLKPHGALTIDAGAVRSLTNGKSLLPVGIVAVDGTFQRGDAVIIQDDTGRDIGRGLVAYGSDEVQRIKGRRSAETQRILGYSERDEVIHRDNLVLND